MGMREKPQVVLLGDSVLMDSLSNNLCERQFFEIVRINSSSRDLPELTQSLKPDLIIYEYSMKFSQLMHALLCEKPNTLLMIIDLYCSQVIVLNCQMRPTHTMQELCELIREEIQHCSARKEVH